MNYFIRHLYRHNTFNSISNILRKKSSVTDFVSPSQKCQFFVRPFSDTFKRNDITDEFINDITNNDPELANRLKIVMLEVEVMRQDGRRAPEVEFLSKHHWEHMLSLPSRSGRQKYVAYLWRNEKLKENEKEKKEVSRKNLLEVQALRALEEKKDTDYGLTKNSMFLRIYDTSINQLYHHRLMQAMMFGQKIILDCSYDKHMTVKEALNAAKQLTLLFADNRTHDEPFDLQLCNCSPHSITLTQLLKNIPTLQEPSYPITMYNNSYMDNFPKEKLVYLTPHCRNDLTEFDHDAIYIIGCMVDKIKTDPISLAKAKQDGIKMARLPLDKYLQWGSGSGKSLTINQVCNILLDLRKTGDWNLSLKHVPVRKLVRANVLNENTNTSDARKQIFRDRTFPQKKEKKNYNDEEDIPSNFKKRRLYSRTSLWSSE